MDNNTCCPPPLSALCNPNCFCNTSSHCSASTCCSPCLEPCTELPPPRPLPVTCAVTVCSVCRPPACPQPCKLCPIVRCSKMLFVAPPHRRGYARYVPPPSAIPRTGGCGKRFRICAPYASDNFLPPMKFYPQLDFSNFPPPPQRNCNYSC